MKENNEEIKITKANFDAAYAVADENTRKVLDALTGATANARPKPTLSDYTTIRYYEDACEALGESLDIEKLKAAGVPNHIIALMKLEHICKAMWGGENKCQPAADGSRVYWYPWFALYTKQEVAYMSDDNRRALLSAHASYGANAGFGCLDANARSSWAGANGAFRLSLDTEEKAEYFGKQFVELWAEYLAYNFTVGEHLK